MSLRVAGVDRKQFIAGRGCSNGWTSDYANESFWIAVSKAIQGGAMTNHADARASGALLDSQPRQRIAAMCLLISLLSPAPLMAEINRDGASIASRGPAVMQTFEPDCDASSIAQYAAAGSCHPSPRSPKQLAQYLSNACYTPVGWCFLPHYAPVGSACWCATPYGPVGGIVR